MKAIYFDMDGTVADLYGEPNWLEDLRAFNPRPYINAKPLVDMDRLQEVCLRAINKGYKIGVITWLSKDSNQRYDQKVIEAKFQWLQQFMPYITEYYAQPYGIPKQKAVAKRCSEMWLIDDNAEVREMWNSPKVRKSIDANLDIIAEIEKIILGV